MLAQSLGGEGPCRLAPARAMAGGSAGQPVPGPGPTTARAAGPPQRPSPTAMLGCPRGVRCAVCAWLMQPSGPEGAEGDGSPALEDVLPRTMGGCGAAALLQRSSRAHGGSAGRGAGNPDVHGRLVSRIQYSRLQCQHNPSIHFEDTVRVHELLSLPLSLSLFPRSRSARSFALPRRAAGKARGMLPLAFLERCCLPSGHLPQGVQQHTRTSCRACQHAQKRWPRSPVPFGSARSFLCSWLIRDCIRCCSPDAESGPRPGQV
jgi:hypothetical protein